MRLAVALLLAAAICVADHHNPKEDRQQAQSEVTTYVGVVDQVGSEYVIGKGKERQGKMYLRAQGFSPDNFARFVGQRVQVQGRISADGDRKTFTVTNLDTFKILPPENE